MANHTTEPGAISRLNELRQRLAQQVEIEKRRVLREERMADLLETCLDYVPNGLADEIREVLDE